MREKDLNDDSRDVSGPLVFPSTVHHSLKNRIMNAEEYREISIHPAVQSGKRLLNNNFIF